MGSAGILPAECGILPHHFSCTFTRTKRFRQHARAPLRACPTKIRLAPRHRIHFEQKNAVGQALRLPQFFDGSSSSGSRLAALGTTGYLFRYNLCRQSRTGFGERAGLWSFQSGSGEASTLDRSGCCFDARPFARHRVANRCSRCQAWEFFGSTETLDSPRAKRSVELAAGLF